MVTKWHERDVKLFFDDTGKRTSYSRTVFYFWVASLSGSYKVHILSRPSQKPIEGIFFVVFLKMASSTWLAVSYMY